MISFEWLSIQGGRGPLLFKYKETIHSTKTFLLCEVSLEFQRRTWNFSVANPEHSSRTAAYCLCPFKTRKHSGQWNNCSYFSWVQNETRFQPANAYHFTVTKQFMIISSRIHFPSKQGYGYQQQQLYFASLSSC